MARITEGKYLISKVIAFIEKKEKRQYRPSKNKKTYH